MEKMIKETGMSRWNATKRVLLGKEYATIFACVSTVVKHIANNPEAFLMFVTALFWNSFSMGDEIFAYIKTNESIQNHQIFVGVFVFLSQNVSLFRGFMLGLGGGAIGLYIIPPDGDKMRWYLLFSFVCTLFLLFVRLPIAIILGSKLQMLLITFCLISGYTFRHRWVKYLKEYY
jgi:hypothetical protein